MKHRKFHILRKEDGLIINFFKTCFLILTLLYSYVSICTIVGLLNPLEQPLPSSENIETIWLYYTIAYLLVCVVHVMILKLIRFIRKKLNKDAVKQ